MEDSIKQAEARLVFLQSLLMKIGFLQQNNPCGRSCVISEIIMRHLFVVILKYSFLNVVLPTTSLIIVSTLWSSICNDDSINQSTPTGAIIRSGLLMCKNMLPKMRHFVFSRHVRPCVNCYVTQKCQSAAVMLFQ